MIRGNEKSKLTIIPSYEFFKPQIKKTAALFLEAANYSDDKVFKNNPEFRAKTLITDDYFESNMA